MKIRSITLLADIEPGADLSLKGMFHQQLRRLGAFAREARRAFEGAGVEVQTLRLAGSFWPALLASAGAERPAARAARLEEACRAEGFEYLSLGPAGTEGLPHVAEVLAATQTVFASAHVLDPLTGVIDGQAIRGAARVIRRAAQLEEGFANLRFAALANVPPGSPFFPSAYHRGGPPAFALATQAADLALDACQTAQDAGEAQRRLTAAIQAGAAPLVRVAEQLSRVHGVPFGGIDFSLAPYPTPECSIGAALEALAGRPLGSTGTLAAAATLTSAIAQAEFPRTGFCGLFLPVLEDSVLAQRAAEGSYSVGDLLHWSAVCGTGLDTVPLPGAASEACLAALLWEVAALAARLGKPLTARLMPLPGKAAGDPVEFDFPYFAPGGVMSLGREGEGGLLPATGWLTLQRRA